MIQLRRTKRCDSPPFDKRTRLPACLSNSSHQVADPCTSTPTLRPDSAFGAREHLKSSFLHRLEDKKDKDYEEGWGSKKKESAGFEPATSSSPENEAGIEERCDVRSNVLSNSPLEHTESQEGSRLLAWVKWRNNNNNRNNHIVMPTTIREH